MTDNIRGSWGNRYFKQCWQECKLIHLFRVLSWKEHFDNRGKMDGKRQNSRPGDHFGAGLQAEGR